MTDRAFQRAAASANSRPIHDGRVAEWFKAPVLKTGRGATLSWVRIPPLPPIRRSLPFATIRKRPKNVRVYCLSVFTRSPSSPIIRNAFAGNLRVERADRICAHSGS